LVRRQKDLIGTDYSWRQRLGEGRHAGEYLALVACRGEQAVGHIGVGPLNLRPELQVFDRTQGEFDPSTLPWWKIHSLGVDPAHQGTGLGVGLLGAVLERMPAGLVGLVGNVEDTRADVIAWYRRRGFYVAAYAPLRRREGDPITAIRLMAVPGEVFFHGYRHTIAEHLDGTGRAGFAERIARVEFRRLLRTHKTALHPRGDLGYRQLASRIADRVDLPECAHAAMSPQPLLVAGWDPQLMRVCGQCQLARLAAIQTYDSSDHCDGCGNSRSDVEMSWASDERAMLIVTAGLCSDCRAGIP
jgi:predicted N-acetyltransferase YhbS